MILWIATSLGLALVAAMPLLMAATFAIAWRRRSRAWVEAALPVIRACMLPLTTIAILTAALRPGDILPGDEYAINWEPFRDLRTSVASGYLVGIAIQNLVGNAAMFVPFGLAVRVTVPRVSAALIVLLAAVVSAAIEVAQAALALGRSADITDVIMNSIGAAAGIGLWSLVGFWGRRQGPDQEAGQVAISPDVALESVRRLPTDDR